MFVLYMIIFGFVIYYWKLCFIFLIDFFFYCLRKLFFRVKIDIFSGEKCLFLNKEIKNMKIKLLNIKEYNEY